MAGHLLGVLEPSVVLQVNGNTGCPPGVTSDRGEKTRRLGPLPNRSPGVVPVQSPSRYLRSKRINALEQGLAALEACGDNVLVADCGQDRKGSCRGLGEAAEKQFRPAFVLWRRLWRR